MKATRLKGSFSPIAMLKIIKAQVMLLNIEISFKITKLSNKVTRLSYCKSQDCHLKSWCAMLKKWYVMIYFANCHVTYHEMSLYVMKYHEVSWNKCHDCVNHIAHRLYEKAIVRSTIAIFYAVLQNEEEIVFFTTFHNPFFSKVSEFIIWQICSDLMHITILGRSIQRDEC